MDAVTLYQFELCPYCHKVKAAFDVKGISYRKVEVNPMNKKQLPELPADAPKKVPVIEWGDDRIYDSTAILDYLDDKFPDVYRLMPDDEEDIKKTREVEQWVDDDLSYVLPAVIYGKWGDAIRAARVVARTSNFGFLQNAMVRGGGSLIMHQVAKRIVKKRGGDNPEQMLSDEIDRFEDWLGDNDFICGGRATLGDVATHGCLTCIAEFPAFTAIMKRPRMAAWYQRVSALREANRAQA